MKKRTTRYTYSFTLNESTEKDMIDILDSLHGKITIAQFCKIAIEKMNFDLDDLLDCYEYDSEEEKQQDRIKTLVVQVADYKERHK